MSSKQDRRAEELQRTSHSLEDPRPTRKRTGWNTTPNFEGGVFQGVHGDDGDGGDVCYHNWWGLNVRNKSCPCFLVVETIETIAMLLVGNGALAADLADNGDFEVVASMVVWGVASR